MSGMPARGICHICVRMPCVYLSCRFEKRHVENIDVEFVLSCSFLFDLIRETQHFKLQSMEVTVELIYLL